LRIDDLGNCFPQLGDRGIRLCGRRSVMKTQYDEKKSAHGEVC
jgi:hypothetical protein